MSLAELTGGASDLYNWVHTPKLHYTQAHVIVPSSIKLKHSLTQNTFFMQPELLLSTDNYATRTWIIYGMIIMCYTKKEVCGTWTVAGKSLSRNFIV
jgi:hypothetical protein